MYTAYCSDSRRALDHFNGGIFEEAKPQLEDDCILPALHDLVKYQNPSAPSYRLPHSSGERGCTRPELAYITLPVNT